MNDFDRAVNGQVRAGETPDAIAQEMGRAIGRHIKESCKRMPAKLEMARTVMEAMKDQMR